MKLRKLAVLETALLLPAVFFLSSVALRELHLLSGGPASFAGQVVGWYAARMWTLWVLLLALPLVVLGTGCAALLAGRAKSNANTHAEQPNATPLEVSRRPPSSTRYFLGATTATAGLILTIVVLHMLAN
jgi:hypothetical protein